jgi:hypothetical protein
MPVLPDDERAKVLPILAKLRLELEEASGGNQTTLFSMKRYIAKRLEFDERSTPTQRRKLKDHKLKSQRGLCAVCKEKLPERGAELDRFVAMDGYTKENTQLVCQACHRKAQEDRDFGSKSLPADH